MNGLTPSTHRRAICTGTEWAHPRPDLPRLTTLARLSGLTRAHICTGTEWAHPCTHLHRDMDEWANPSRIWPGMGFGFFVFFVLQPPQRMTLRCWCARAHAHTHRHTLSRTHINTHAHKQTQAHARTHACTHARTNARTHTRIDTFKWVNYQWQHFKWDRRTGDATMGTHHSIEGGCK